MSTCIVVLGVARSGTSVVSGILHRLGVVMGWELQSEDGKPRYDWPDAIEMNPLGFYQDAPVENALYEIWGNDYPPVGARAPKDSQYITEFKRLIKARSNRGHPYWGIKVSHMPWVVNEFIEACIDTVKIISTNRPLHLSSKSIQTWFPDASMDQCDEWVNCASGQIKAVLNKVKLPRLIVDFDELHDNTDKVVNEIADFVGLPLNAEARAFVKPGLRRVK